MLFTLRQWLARTWNPRHTKRRPAIVRPSGIRRQLERLEDRNVPSVYLVTGTADGPGNVTASATPGVNFNATTLRAAVNAANAHAGPDVIILPASASAYKLTTDHQLLVTDNLTIDGAGPAVSIIDGNLATRIFEVKSASTITLTLNGLTVRNGRAPLGDVPAHGAEDSSGGGILLQGTDDLTMTNCVVTGNQADAGSIAGDFGSAFGGGIYNDAGTTSLTNCTVSNNQANGGTLLGGEGGGVAEGGGICSQGLAGTPDKGLVTIVNSTLAHNTATGGTNTAGDPGGNAAGGGLYVNLGNARVISSTFNNNQADGGNTNFGGDDFGGNAFGGAIDSEDQLTVIDSTLTANQANGGILVGGEGSNDGEAQGGGINAFDATISNSTITLNQANSRSSAFGGGVACSNEVSIVTVTSTIIATNTVSPGESSGGPDVSGAFTSGFHNLIGIEDSDASGFTDNRVVPPGNATYEQVGSVAHPIDPILGPLQFNGGPTMTEAELPGSPAINRGSNPDGLAYDQRGSGFLRTVEQTDVGAFEVQPISKRAYLISTLTG